jgi:hypothetical protein
MNNFDPISNSLDIESKEISKEYIKKSKKEISKPLADNHTDSDYEYTRKNLYDLIEKGQESIYEILEIAKESQKARDFEVAGQIIKNVGDLTDKLLDLQHKMKKLKEGGDPTTNSKSITNNSLFIGSTAELQKFLKDAANK